MSGLGPLVNNPSLWEEFLKYLGEEEEGVRKRLERSDTPTEIFRHQGELRNIRKMMALRETINNKFVGVHNG